MGSILVLILLYEHTVATVKSAANIWQQKDTSKGK